jgi:hypothetical protein
MVYYLFPNSNGWMYVCAHIDNGLVEESKELTGEVLSSSWLVEASVP